MTLRVKKIACSALCAVILVAFCCFSFVFADSSSTPPVFTFGVDVPIFSQLIDGMPFYFGFTSLPSVMDDFEPLFNDVSYKVVTVSGNSIVVQVQRNNETRPLSSFDYTTQLLGFKYSSGSCRTGVSSRSNPSSDPSGWAVTPNLANLSVSYGSTFEWTSGSAVIDRFYFSLPYGNVLMISSESGFTINRRSYNISNTTYNYQKYVRASDNFSYRVNGAYQGVVENSNVVGTFGVNVFGSNDVMSLLIPWQPVNQNVLGRATAYNYYNAALNPSDEISVSSGQSFMIWYPYYANNQDTSKINETNMEVAIDIYHSSPITFTTYPITGSSATSGEDSYIQNTASVSSGGSSSQSDGGDGTITVTFDNAPTAGGNHGQAPINDNNSILGVLSNLQNTLLGLFNKAIDGIHNLISLGSDFLQSVQIMFSWLPAELLVIITSGFVILLTIGVLKTLWR